MEITRAAMDQDPEDMWQSIQQALSVLQLHVPTQRATGPQVSAVVFMRIVFSIKSAFRNVYSPVHVCFDLFCVRQQEGLCVCVLETGGWRRFRMSLQNK